MKTDWIGYIELKNPGEDKVRLRAFLNPDGTWECNDKQMELILNTYHNPASGDYLSVLPFGIEAVYDAAKVFHGHAVLRNTPQPLPPGVVS